MASIEAFTPTSTYRADIDGLRAIAVTLVICFHASSQLVSGGFIGVDVFFVISGFLIGGNLFRAIHDDQYDLIDFYRRRILRIFPALLAVFVLSSIAGWFLLAPVDLALLGKHIGASAAFFSNLLYWTEAGYFDNDALTKPMLHLWSLGVEEQFYLVVPLVFPLYRKHPRLFSAFLWLTMLLMLFYSQYAAKQSAALAYFSPLSRFWELGIGVIIAAAMSRPHPQSGGLNQPPAFIHKLRTTWVRVRESYFAISLLSLVGIILIFCSAGRLTKQSTFPGFRAIPATLGTAMVLVAGSVAWPNKKLLSNRVLTLLGRISYPLYLWHYVILVFPRLILAEPLSQPAIIGGICTSVVLAYATTRFIENPIRLSANRHIWSVVLLIMMLTVGISGTLLWRFNGLPNRSFFAGNMVNYGDVGHIEFHSHIRANFFPCTDPAVLRESMDFDGQKRCQYDQIFPKNKCSISLEFVQENQFAYYNDDLAHVLRAEPRISLIDTFKPFCNKIACNMNAHGKIHFRDGNHLNLPGSRFIANYLAKDENFISFWQKARLKSDLKG
jgi:peptidoglycan/LPS O-acetylase OafA/YrhL